MEFKALIIVCVVISLTLSVYFVKTALNVYDNKDAIDIAKQELDEAKKQQEQYKKELNYAQTDEFIINEARQKLNYGFDGESIVIVPINEDTELESKQSQVEDNVIIENNIGDKNPTSSRPIILDWFQLYFGG